MDTSSVPLMDDIEGEEVGQSKTRGMEAGLDNDFAYNNNVAGASKHVRLGKIGQLEQFWLIDIDNIPCI